MSIGSKEAWNAAFAAKEYQKAVEAFSEAIEYDSNNHILYSNRSAAYASMGKFSEALQDANRCIELKADWPKGYSRKATALYGLGQLEQAIAAYDQGLSFDPNNQALLEGKQEVLNKMNNQSSGGGSGIFGPETMAKLAMNPNTRKLLQDPSFMAILKEMQQNPSAIGKYLQDPRVMEVLSVLTGMRFDSSFPDASDSSVNQTPTHEASSETIHETKTPTKEEKDNTSTNQSLNKEEEYKEENNNQREAQKEKELGNQCYKNRQFTQAIEHYNKAMEWDPLNVSLLTNRAAVYFEMGEYDQCLEDCQKAIELNQQHSLRTDYRIIARAYARMANAYWKKNDYAQAIACYENSLLEYHDDKVQSKLNQVKQERRKAEEEAYIDPEISKKEREEGNQLYKEGKFPQALEKYTEAIKRNPKDPVPYSNRAATYTKLGQFPSALSDCEKCLQLDPNFTRAYARKGAIHYYMKEFHKSLDAYQKGLQVDSNNAELKEGLQKTLHAISEQTSEKPDEEQIKHAMADPEIQKILMDPILQNVLQEAQSDPSSIQKAMTNPGMAAKIQKLIAAGVLRVG
eukprot:jgi/Galph1/2368/GphlegSOOS_G1041.1